MQLHPQSDWLSRLVTVDEALSRIRPGMSIFLGTGVAEPRTLVRRLMASEDDNLKDLELVRSPATAATFPWRPCGPTSAG